MVIFLSIIDNLIKLLNEKNIPQNELCAHLDITTSTFSTWKKRNSDPPSKYIIRICEFLRVSPEELLSGKKSESTMDELDEIEKKLIFDFRSLSQQGQDYIRQQMFMAREVYKKEQDLPQSNMNVG